VEKLEVIAEISPRDAMYVHAAVAHRAQATEVYLQSGVDALRAVVLAILAARKPPPQTILDFGAGHGRVLRMFRAAFPEAALTACDIDRDAVDFCGQTFGAEGVYSEDDPRQLEFSSRFDLIWCGSVFTHHGAERWDQFLELLAGRLLAPDGLLVFSTCGRQVERTFAARDLGLAPEAFARLLSSYRSEGFGYEPYPAETEGLASYGFSLAAPGWIFDRLSKRPELRFVSFFEKGWWNHDVTACSRAQSL
jgi:SAM-dependent methyltransferase